MKIIFASGNQHKVKEISMLLGYEYQLKSLKDIGFMGEIPETGETFEANASIKSTLISKLYYTDCIADDSGLEVFSLGGAPGVFSARYAGIGASDDLNTEFLLKNMNGISERSARFVTVLCLTNVKGKNHFFRGELNGSIIKEKRGENGFGYDPIFVPEGFDKTLAEMSPMEKNTISHRAKALEKLMKFLKE